MTAHNKSGNDAAKKRKSKVATRSVKADRTERPSYLSSTKADREPALVNERFNYFLAIKGKLSIQAGNKTENLINLVRSGVTKSAYDRMLAESGLPAEELAGILRISERTLRRYDPRKTLPSEQSERLVELASLYSRGEEVFESLERFKEWMSRSQIAFGNQTPKTFLDTSMGIGMILDELGRIEHGVFA